MSASRNQTPASILGALDESFRFLFETDGPFAIATAGDSATDSQQAQQLNVLVDDFFLKGMVIAPGRFKPSILEKPTLLNTGIFSGAPWTLQIHPETGFRTELFNLKESLLIQFLSDLKKIYDLSKERVELYKFNMGKGRNAAESAAFELQLKREIETEKKELNRKIRTWLTKPDASETPSKNPINDYFDQLAALKKTEVEQLKASLIHALQQIKEKIELTFQNYKQFHTDQNIIKMQEAKNELLPILTTIKTATKFWDEDPSVQKMITEADEAISKAQELYLAHQVNQLDELSQAEKVPTTINLSEIGRFITNKEKTVKQLELVKSLYKASPDAAAIQVLIDLVESTLLTKNEEFSSAIQGYYTTTFEERFNTSFNTDNFLSDTHYHAIKAHLHHDYVEKLKAIKAHNHNEWLAIESRAWQETLDDAGKLSQLSLASREVVELTLKINAAIETIATSPKILDTPDDLEFSLLEGDEIQDRFKDVKTLFPGLHIDTLDHLNILGERMAVLDSRLHPSIEDAVTDIERRIQTLNQNIDALNVDSLTTPEPITELKDATIIFSQKIRSLLQKIKTTPLHPSSDVNQLTIRLGECANVLVAIKSNLERLSQELEPPLPTPPASPIHPDVDHDMDDIDSDLDSSATDIESDIESDRELDVDTDPESEPDINSDSEDELELEFEDEENITPVVISIPTLPIIDVNKLYLRPQYRTHHELLNATQLPTLFSNQEMIRELRALAIPSLAITTISPSLKNKQLIPLYLKTPEGSLAYELIKRKLAIDKAVKASSPEENINKLKTQFQSFLSKAKHELSIALRNSISEKVPQKTRAIEALQNRIKKLDNSKQYASSYIVQYAQSQLVPRKDAQAKVNEILNRPKTSTPHVFLKATSSHFTGIRKTDEKRADILKEQVIINQATAPISGRTVVWVQEQNQNNASSSSIIPGKKHTGNFFSQVFGISTSPDMAKEYLSLAMRTVENFREAFNKLPDILSGSNKGHGQFDKQLTKAIQWYCDEVYGHKINNKTEYSLSNRERLAFAKALEELRNDKTVKAKFYPEMKK